MLLTIAIASAIAITSCSSNSQPEEGSANAPGQVVSQPPTSVDETKPYQPPVLSAVSVALGAGLEDIYRAVLTRRRTAAEECVTASGWTISQAELDDLYDPGPDDGGGTIAYIDQLIAEFSQPPPAPTNSTNQIDRQRVDRIVSCMDEAESAYPNPNTMILTAIEDFDAAVSARVAGDQRVVDARHRRDDCTETHGVPAQGGQDPLGVLSQRIADVQMAAFEGGGAARATAVNDLRSLRETAVDVEACYAAYNRAIQPVVDEVQSAELASRPDLIPSIVQQTATLMDQYRELLPK
jgi:hypothetical protein